MFHYTSQGRKRRTEWKGNNNNCSSSSSSSSSSSQKETRQLADAGNSLHFSSRTEESEESLISGTQPISRGLPVISRVRTASRLVWQTVSVLPPVSMAGTGSFFFYLVLPRTTCRGHRQEPMIFRVISVSRLGLLGFSFKAWIYLASASLIGSYWILPSFPSTTCPWTLSQYINWTTTSFTRLYLALAGFTGFYWVLLGFPWRWPLADNTSPGPTGFWCVNTASRIVLHNFL